MDLEKIKYYIKVCECKNLTKAADELFISQPTLSRHIRALESELGVTLLTRKSSGVEITEAGKIFLKDAVKFQEAKEALTNNVFKYKNNYSGSINIGIDPHTEVLAAYYASKTFQQKNPDINVNAHILPPAELFESYLNETIDIAYSSRILFPDVYDSTLATIMPNHLILKVPHGHRLYDEKEIKIHDFVDEILFIPNKRNFPLAEATLQALEKNNVKIKNAVFFENYYDCYFQAAMNCKLTLGGRFGIEKTLDINPVFRHHPIPELDINSADICAMYRIDNTLACHFVEQLLMTGQKHSLHYLKY